MLARSGEVIDPPRARERSFCCGAGGGLAFLGEEQGERVSHNRARELAATGAGTVAAACPFCNTMFRDALAAVSPCAAEIIRRRPDRGRLASQLRVRCYEHAGRAADRHIPDRSRQCIAAHAPAKPEAAKSKAAPLTAEQRAAQALMRPMSLRDKVAQLVIVNANGDVYSTKSPDYEKYRHWVADLHVGGIIINNTSQYGLVRNAEPHAMAVFLNQMQRLAKTPLLVASDFERAASMRVTGGTRFPHSMAFAAAGDLAATKYEGLIAAREARALGIHWIFAPVADVNNNPLNPIINLRSYGEDPEQVSRYVAAFIEGAHSDPANRVLVTAKHFPGHGDTDVDSHLGLPRLEVSARASRRDGAEALRDRHRARRRFRHDRAHVRARRSSLPACPPPYRTTCSLGCCATSSSSRA